VAIGDPLLEDTELRGAAWCGAHTLAVDRWLSSLFATAVTAAGAPIDDRVALVAIGGYGREELCPQSDIDVMLLHGGKRELRDLPDRLWYPIWDAGMHLGHSVSTIPQALELADDDLDTATSLLSARHVAGDADLTRDLAEQARRRWQAKSKKWLTQLTIRVRERQQAVGDVAFALEPDLKEGRGGLRDVHSVEWAEFARPLLHDADRATVHDAYETLLGVRVELQRHTQRASNVVVLEDRDAIAQRLGLADGDALMGNIAEAARAIAWRSDEAWRRAAMNVRGPLGRITRRTRMLAAEVELRDGEVFGGPEVVHDREGCLAVASAAARAGAAIARETLEQLASATARAGAIPGDAPWTDTERQGLIDLLATGRSAIPVVEALDQVGVWAAMVLPEWTAVRARPQHNPYHLYTVDRHLLEATANASRLASRVDRVDLLLVATLLHDLGKGYPGDHTQAGITLARTIVPRLGFSGDDADTVRILIEHHLLLADVATRRDLDDESTIQRVASAVGTSSVLRLLYALTEADARATGPSAWTSWKAELVAQLVERVDHLLTVGQPAENDDAFPTPDQLAALQSRTQKISSQGDTLTVVTSDRPGTFSRIAGVLALHGVDVLSAVAYSNEAGRALSEFRVADRLRGSPPWTRIVEDVERALDGRLALSARIAERAQIYERRRRLQPARDASVRFDDDASMNATVIDVHANDAIGVLFRITRALAELDLDIRSAKVNTVGREVVDAFYVVDRRGNRVDDPAIRAEIERGIRHALAEGTTN
jgi:[protein-PII] uridylyltransferase